ncbi:hypothetical protein [Hydrogenophaga sp. ZJX-1]|uniref:hypothetical protein n=1 Tax=Hydrogenophaga sp. ZJX-1 TaxID=3404778 RepID=UPI003B28B880
MNRNAMKRIFKAIPLTWACGVLLSACGGGGADTPSDPIDKYVGTWVGACASGGANKWVSYTWSFAKATTTTATGELKAYIYGNATCQGKPLGGESGTFPLVALAGTTTASGRAADKLALTHTNNKVTRYVFATEGSVLYSSMGTNAPLDAEGFPTGLKLDYPYELKP